MNNQSTQNKQKTSSNSGKPAPTQRFQSPKQPYAMKLLEDALRKNEDELELWKNHIRKFDWLYCKKEYVSGCDVECVLTIKIGYKDGFNNEFVSEPIILKGNRNRFKQNDYSQHWFPKTIEEVKIDFMKSITNEQAEGNFSPCENRIIQIKEAIEILKTNK